MEGITAALQTHRRVGIDTSVFIYHLEATSRYADCAASLFNGLAGGAFEGVTSILTLMELAVKPLKLGRPDVADEYEVILSNFPHLALLNLDRAVARGAAELRAAYRLRPADALQVSACVNGGATAFVSNDRDFRRVAEIEVLLLEDYIT